ncbi:hypothetical protein L228DRAFT_243588 [Xylona heveae TC161]|uniref:Phospholipid/glycerol acyltransferase domain-containing protein n=1 Tax=Xylona heveae (strain CBS 132557 / TC161) TaxID=1328760 RepID=A0A165IGA8_XYLHT|nr:hypothetical protein L228DRAFT_243588 [Xylona heveae TC161]KZF24854.1 hypothetical protein L228DRAFT_243588 [Xylona heveae TC161]
MPKRGEFAPLNTWSYDAFIWIFSVLVDLFFREVHPRGAWKIPRKGPVMFVAAPHANQFVDPLILMRVIRMEARRRISFLTAEKSMKRKFIGMLSRMAGAVPVARAMDATKPATGVIYLPDPVNDPTLVRGIGTKFDGPEIQLGGLLVLPSVNGKSANAEVAEVISAEELRLKKPYRGAVAYKQLTGREDFDDSGKPLDGVDNLKNVLADGFEGTKFKTAPKVDQTQVYNAVFDRLIEGGCVGIFPEGGSHDRTELLPLKAGVAIMALGALAADPECGLKIIPCGMNYFHAHKFRSRAVIEFGYPIDVPMELVDMYKKGERREAIGQLLEIIYQALVSVTVTSPDFETLLFIQAARRLYNPTGKKLPLPMVVELNRRLVKGYTQYKDDPRIVHLKNEVSSYNKQLRLLGIRDYQVEYAKFSIPKVLFTLLYRIIKLSLLTIGTLPGLVLFAPVFIATKIISRKKSKEALAASTVKIQGRDVMATWKLLVALAFAPLLYNFYAVLLTWWTYHDRVAGYAPNWVSLWMVPILGWIIFPSISFAAFRIGETGMDILKSLRPLILALNPSSANTFVKLRERRAKLSKEVIEVINTLGPEMYPDFDASRIVSDPFREGALPPAFTSRHASRANSFQYASESSKTPGVGIGGGSSAAGDLPRNDSFWNIGSFGFFTSRPTTPSRSRSRSRSNSSSGGGGGFSMQAFSKLDSKEGFDEVSQKIRGAMRERRRRKSESEWELASNDGSEEGRKEI